MKTIIYFLIAISSSLLLFAQELKPIQLQEGVVQRLGLESSMIQKNIISDPVIAVAKLRLDPAKTRTVASLFSGQIGYDCALIGQQVKKNDLLLTLNSREVAEVVAEYIKASSKLKSTSLLYKREKSLRARKLTTEDSYLAAKSSYEEAQALQIAAQQIASMAKSDSQLKALKQGALPADSSKLQILAPISGVIIKQSSNGGSVIEANHELYQIADFSTLLVEIKLPLQALNHIQLGDVIHFKSVVGREKKGTATISRILPQVDASSLTQRVFATLNNTKNEWTAGTPVSVAVTNTSEKPRLSVPTSAVVNIGGKSCVFIDQGNGSFLPVEITTGQHSQSFTEITSDLAEKIKVVTKGASLLLAAWNERISE